jgi:hypothetical protein
MELGQDDFCRIVEQFEAMGFVASCHHSTCHVVYP